MSSASASTPSGAPSSPAPSDTTSAPGQTSTTSPASVPSTTPAGGGSSSAAAGGGGAGGGAGGGGGGTPVCSTGQLALSLLPGDGGASAGHQHYTIQFTNQGGSACTLYGNPGVSLVTGSSGQQLGAAASREGTPSLVRLGAGASAYANISVAEAGNYDSSQCRPQAATGLRVYPPGQTAAAFVPASGITGCASTSVVLLVADPVVAGR
nr:DUF4232 domain-containing protein [Quadrisphaera sp. RL12-1S]